jgi:hypothetical protein
MPTSMGAFLDSTNTSCDGRAHTAPSEQRRLYVIGTLLIIVHSPVRQECDRRSYSIHSVSAGKKMICQ